MLAPPAHRNKGREPGQIQGARELLHVLFQRFRGLIDPKGRSSTERQMLKVWEAMKQWGKAGNRPGGRIRDRGSRGRVIGLKERLQYCRLW